jgi:hypothetical protein
MSITPLTTEPTGGCSLAELIEFILPGALTGPCPTWTPDAFAVAATLMRRTGAYVRCLGTGGQPTASLLLDDEWPNRAQATGEAWRRAICEALKAHAGSGKPSLESAVLKAVLPLPVTDAWDTLCSGAKKPLNSCKEDDSLTRALLELSGYADEASWSIGLEITGDQDEYGEAARLFLELNDKQSFCHRVDPQKARVLGKKHTPQQGLTLRSLTHHLSLCMPWEVEPLWFDLDSPRLDDVLNLLLLPWPYEVKARDFQYVDPDSAASELRGDCLFTYTRESRPDSEVKKWILGAIGQAKRQVSKVHAVVLPELALTRSEWKIAETVAIGSGVMLISGVIDDTDDKTGLPMNSCRIQMMSLPPRGGTGEVTATAPPAFRQAKHHRWCLDRQQVLQYDLGGQLPSAMRCWENSHIGSRRIFFAHLGGWLTFSVLICEDLARQDPIADVLRSVGPNLVIALLMDGPQLAARWPARYASVLADDPGSSVLTLTSLGMSQRSRPAGGGKAGSRVVALWKDKLYGTREIVLPQDCNACVLSLTRERREEYTADGRSDGKATEVPVYSGVFPI